VSRRTFLLGAAGAAGTAILAACGGSATDTPKAQATTGGAATTAPTTAAAAATKPAGSADAPSGTTAPAATTAGGATPAAAGASPVTNLTLPADSKRGAGGTLRLLWWQAPTILNSQIAQGTKDYDASRLVEEPLATLTNDAITPDVPVLAKEIPSVQNGELAADGTSVTWKLRDSVVWSDGQPFTADDVVFTWQFIMKPENGSTSTSLYSDIDKVEAVDPTTAKITFKAPAAAWFVPYVGDGGEILPKHVVGTCPDSKNCDFNQKPVGTGAYVVTDFKAGDTVTYKANEKFREPNAPYFATVELKGGGDATTAAKAVQTGQADFAWNLTVTPEVIKQLTDAGKTVATPSGFYVEQLELNMADPRNEVDGELSNAKSKNPYFSDPLVRQAFSYVVDRDSIAKNLWGPGGVAGNTLIPVVRGDKGAPYSYGLKKAADLLDQAGWKKGSDGIRAKNGVPLKIVFTSTVNPIREKTEQVIKQSFQQAGISMDIKNVDSGVFFGAPTNADAAARFERDMQMWTLGPLLPDAQVFFEGFTTAQIAQKANNWSGTNYDRYSDPKYDALVDQLKKELDPEKRAQLQIQCNDYLMNNHVEIPIVDRASVNGHRSDLINTNPTPWDWSVWNIAYWQIKR